MERNCAASGQVVILQLDSAEILAFHSFLALGAHFAAIISGEHSPFSPDEIRSLIATVGASPSKTLMDKLAEAIALKNARSRAATKAASAAPREGEVIRSQSRGA
jgi:hypothetical protein